MGNTHGKKYHESLKTKNESDKTLKMLLDIASKGREEKNLVQYGKKEKFLDDGGNNIKMAFHHVISANLLKQFIHNLSCNALNHKDKDTDNQSLKLLNKIMFKSVLKYSQDSEYFFGFRNPELKTINFLTQAVNDIKKEVEKTKNDAKKQVPKVDNSITKDAEETLKDVIKKFDKAIQNKPFLKKLNDCISLASLLKCEQKREDFIKEDFTKLDMDAKKESLKEICSLIASLNEKDIPSEIAFIKKLQIVDSPGIEKTHPTQQNQSSGKEGSSKTPKKKDNKLCELKSSFEVHADKIIDPQRYEAIKEINDLMLKYLKDNTTPDKIYKLFSEVVGNDYQEFNKQDWTFVDNSDKKEDVKLQKKENLDNVLSDKILEESKELTKSWNSAGFDSSEADMGNDFLSQIDLFVGDFTASCGDKLSEQGKDAVTKSIASSLLSIFIWLPYNIFKGPSDRLDDPARAKEENKDSESGWKIKEQEPQNQKTNISLSERFLNLNNSNQIIEKKLDSNDYSNLNGYPCGSPKTVERISNPQSDSKFDRTKNSYFDKGKENSSKQPAKGSLDLDNAETPKNKIKFKINSLEKVVRKLSFNNRLEF